MDTNKILEGAARFAQSFKFDNLQQIGAIVFDLLSNPSQFFIKRFENQASTADILLNFVAVVTTIAAVSTILIYTLVGVSTPVGIFRVPLLNAIMGGVYEIGMACAFVLLGTECLIKVGRIVGIELNYERVATLLGYSLTPALFGRVVYALPSIGLIGAVGLLVTLYMIFQNLRYTILTNTEHTKVLLFSVVGSALSAAILVFLFTITEGMRASPAIPGY